MSVRLEPPRRLPKTQPPEDGPWDAPKVTVRIAGKTLTMYDWQARELIGKLSAALADLRESLSAPS